MSATYARAVSFRPEARSEAATRLSSRGLTVEGDRAEVGPHLMPHALARDAQRIGSGHQRPGGLSCTTSVVPLVNRRRSDLEQLL